MKKYTTVAEFWDHPAEPHTGKPCPAALGQAKKTNQILSSAQHLIDSLTEFTQRQIRGLIRLTIK
ncbi:hypothetical protein ABN070_18665, partial [Morganella morganii]|uniref:hypothetical protein n=1 Tax=Morganella morganii TaxID=582 RepID=UPI0032DBE9A4